MREERGSVVKAYLAGFGIATLVVAVALALGTRVAHATGDPGGNSWPTTWPHKTYMATVNGRRMFCQRWVYENGYIDRCVQKQATKKRRAALPVA